jgi:hypothetical protein
MHDFCTAVPLRTHGRAISTAALTRLTRDFTLVDAQPRKSCFTMAAIKLYHKGLNTPKMINGRFLLIDLEMVLAVTSATPDRRPR